MALPEGYGMQLSVPLSMNSAFNDLRPPNSSSSTYFWEVALQYTTERPAHHVDHWRTNAFPGPMEGALQLFRLPPDQPSMAWSTSDAPFSGRIMAMSQHTHSTSGLVETWYIGAPPTELGLIHGAMAGVRKVTIDNPLYGRKYRFLIGGSQFGAPAWSAWEHPVAAGNEAEMRLSALGDAFDAKKIVLEAMLARGIPFSCVGRFELGQAALGDRQPAFSCFEGGLDVVAGQPLTGVFWYDPATAVKPAPLFQHIHYQAWIDRGPHISSEYVVEMQTSQSPDEISGPISFFRPSSSSATSGSKLLTSSGSGGSGAAQAPHAGYYAALVVVPLLAAAAAGATRMRNRLGGWNAQVRLL